jgi:putative FmdB family regulatory protein
VVPVYEYRCRTCDDVFELRRPMSESSEPATCPDGHPGAVRLLSVFASVGASTSSDSSASAPSMGCGGGCACYPG